eukprot:359118-Chlamydomonas_euryale.AAC.1
MPIHQTHAPAYARMLMNAYISYPCSSLGPNAYSISVDMSTAQACPRFSPVKTKGTGGPRISHHVCPPPWDPILESPSHLRAGRKARRVHRKRQRALGHDAAEPHANSILRVVKVLAVAQQQRVERLAEVVDRAAILHLLQQVRDDLWRAGRGQGRAGCVWGGDVGGGEGEDVERAAVLHLLQPACDDLWR